MGIPVTFSPSPINCGVIQPGAQTTQSTQCAVLSASVNVTASITGDTSGGAITLASVASFVQQTEIETAGPGEVLGGGRVVPVRITVPEQVAQSNGITALAVASGQYVGASVQFAPTPSTPATSKATLVIKGDTWDPVSIPIVAVVGELTVDVPAITVRQGATLTADVTVTSVAGPDTTAKLILSAGGSAEAANVTATLNPASFKVDKGKSASTKLTVSAGSTLATGVYSWSLAVWAFDNAYSFSVPVNIKVAGPYCTIGSKLSGNVIDIQNASTKSGAGLDAYSLKTSGNDNQLWEFVQDPAGSGDYFIKSKLNGNVIDLDSSSLLLDSWPQKAKDNDNQLWEFVSDPAGSGYCFIVNKLNGYVIDIQGASTAAGALLDAYPLKVNSYDNQLWAPTDGGFPSIVKTVPAPSGGLGSRYNYFLYSDCNPLQGVSLTIDVTEDIVFSSASGSYQGFSFQLNCYSPTGYSTTYQQYVIGFLGANLTWGINFYSGSKGAYLAQNTLIAMPSVKLPAGYKIRISLTNDSSGNITSATYVVIDNTGKTQASTTQTVPTGLATPLVAPIVAFELDFVGPYNGESAVLSSGAGSFTYSASTPLSAVNKEPSCCPAKVLTGETANTLYSVLPASPASPLTQSFIVTGT